MRQRRHYDKRPTEAGYSPTTDTKPLLPVRDVGRESETESPCFHGRRVIKTDSEVKHGLPPEDRRPLNNGCG
jgi:hypothetical protein